MKGIFPDIYEAPLSKGHYKQLSYLFYFIFLITTGGFAN